MRPAGVLVLATLAAFNGGCLSSFFGEKDGKSELYLVPSPGVGWAAVDPAEADVAYRNSVDRSILSISSLCGEDRFRPLEELTEDLLKQLPERTTVVAGAPLSADGHAGLVTEARGVIDGKGLTVRVAVLRTPRCVYDVLLAGPALDPSSRAAFDRALQGFREKERK